MIFLHAVSRHLVVFLAELVAVQAVSDGSRLVPSPQICEARITGKDYRKLLLGRVQRGIAFNRCSRSCREGNVIHASPNPPRAEDCFLGPMNGASQNPPKLSSSHRTEGACANDNRHTLAATPRRSPRQYFCSTTPSQSSSSPRVHSPHAAARFFDKRY